MDRRSFIVGALAGAGSLALSSPTRAHDVHRRSRDCGIRLLGSTRLALRGSRRHRMGLTIELAAGPGPSLSIRRTRHRRRGSDPFVELVEHLELRLGGQDHHRLERNLRRLERKLGDILDHREARHFHDHWHHDRSWSTFEVREHLDGCSACRRSFEILIHGTHLEPIPIHFEDEVTVVAPAGGPQPIKALHLPAVPVAMRSALSGKHLVVQARVGSRGRAHVTRVHAPGFSDFVVQRAVDMVERNPWRPGRSASGRPCPEDIRVRFQW